MKAVQIKQYGGTEAIEITQDAANPAVQSGQVVEVHAANLNCKNQDLTFQTMTEEV